MFWDGILRWPDTSGHLFCCRNIMCLSRDQPPSAVRKSGTIKSEHGKCQTNGDQNKDPNVCENARSRGTSTYDVTYNFENSAKRQRQERPGLFIFTSRTDPCQIPTEMVKVGQGNPWCLPCFPWVGCDNAPENRF